MGVGSGFYMYDVVVKRWRSLSHLLMSSCISKAWWFILSNTLLRSILHKLTVLPPLIKRSTIWRTVKIAWLQPIPFLKPNCLLSVQRNSPNFSMKQYSNNFDIIGLMAIPRKSFIFTNWSIIWSCVSEPDNSIKSSAYAMQPTLQPPIWHPKSDPHRCWKKWGMYSPLSYATSYAE